MSLLSAMFKNLFSPMPDKPLPPELAEAVAQGTRPVPTTAEDLEQVMGKDIGLAQVATNAPVFKGEPVPTYPDRGWAVPAVSADLLCESQADLIKRLHQASAFSREEFDALIVPAIYAYASYVHLLPASESHHHCGAGGLFRHGLETAFNAAIACNAKIFAFDHWASQRDKLVPRWRMCAILGGMIHDIGKPIVDIGALDESGNNMWNPHAGSMCEWLEEHRLEHYFIHWREGARHKRHEAFGALAIDRIIPRTTLRWISECGGQEALDSLVMSLSGSPDPNNPLSSIIKDADSKSVNHDIQQSRKRLASTGMGGQRNLAIRLMRVMYGLIESGKWKVNQVGNPIWVTTEGVFGLYPNVIISAIDELRSNGDHQVAREAAPVLQSLADWGFLHANVMPGGHSFNTWFIEIDAIDRGKPVKDFRAHVVRFSKDEIIPNTMIPQEPVTARVLDKDGKPITEGCVMDGDSAEAIAQEEAKKKAATSTSDDSESVEDTEAAVDQELHAPGYEDPEFDEGEPGATTSEPDANPQPEPSLDAGIETQENTRAAQPAQSDPGTEFPPPPPAPPKTKAKAKAPEPLRDRSEEKEVRDELMAEAAKIMTSKWPPTTPEEANAWLDTQDQAGQVMQSIFRRLARGHLREGHDVLEVGENVYLAYPRALKEHGMLEDEARLEFEKKDWLERDRATPNKATVMVKPPNGKPIRSIRLNENISIVASLLMPARNPDANPVEKPRVLPMGKYLGEFESARLQSTTVKIHPSDAVLIRPAFHLFLEDEVRDTQPGRPLEDLTATELRKLIAKFTRMHRRLVVRSLATWLLCTPNPILLGADQAITGENDEVRQQYPLAYNPEYQRDSDVAAGEQMEPVG